ncbi:MAG: glucose-1-phosphate thymidylyltransferase RfbA, partial [Balneolaceae bacterium]
ATASISKQLLPVYDKPMIYYPLSCLMLAGIDEIMIISTPRDIPRFQELLGDGSQWGVSFSYKEQPKPEGIAQAFIIGSEFIGDDGVCLILGDNIFYGSNLRTIFREAISLEEGAVVFGYPVSDPERYGVVDFDSNHNVKSIEEKPRKPKSKYAVTGIYFYDKNVCDIARSLTPSSRGELEITDLNNEYLKRNKLKVKLLGRGVAWLDTGTHHSLQEASVFIQAIQARQGLKISCPEEIAFRENLIDKKTLQNLVKKMKENEYSNYLKQLTEAS